MTYRPLDYAKYGFADYEKGKLVYGFKAIIFYTFGFVKYKINQFIYKGK
jgi:hypothetical protein